MVCKTINTPLATTILPRVATASTELLLLVDLKDIFDGINFNVDVLRVVAKNNGLVERYIAFTSGRVG